MARRAGIRGAELRSQECSDGRFGLLAEGEAALRSAYRFDTFIARGGRGQYAVIFGKPTRVGGHPPYWHMEQLTNLGALPPHGFEVLSPAHLPTSSSARVSDRDPDDCNVGRPDPGSYLLKQPGWARLSDQAGRRNGSARNDLMSTRAGQGSLAGSVPGRSCNVDGNSNRWVGSRGSVPHP
jgi:hypothetical protein